MLGSPALALPYWGLGGEWKNLEKTDCGKEQESLEQLGQYLKGLFEKGTLPFEFEHQRFADDLARGFGFDSNIPTGYGLGSSGALCAAIYAHYVLNPLPPMADHVNDLKSAFALMESYFHGNSSGIDPLVCYMGVPLLLRSRTEVELLPPLHFPEGETVLFLLDTGQPRKTEPLVKLFLEWCEDPVFKKNCQENLVPANIAAIEAFLGASPSHFSPITPSLQNSITPKLKTQNSILNSQFKKISSFQQDHFQPMIPENCRAAWGEGLLSGTYTLKLCGAGGGGFLLGITDNWQLTRQKLPFKLQQLS